ncbi:family 43 glycosylhydrolase [Rheinheimera faecalis]
MNYSTKPLPGLTGYRIPLAISLLCALVACSPEPPPESNADPLAVASALPLPAIEDQSFTNPLFANGADPWLEYWQGNYYLTTTTWTSQLVMRKSPTLAGLATATPVNVWSETNPKSCCNFWAFEFHRLQGPDGPRWYMMYTSGKQENLDGQHLSVLESAGDDPMGPYQYKGSPMPDSWNIDGNYLEHKGKLYLLWSEWEGDEQLNWISQMSNPWTLTGEPMVLSRPSLPWEQSGRKVNEGPEVLKHQGRTFVIYSASFCDTPDYKLGLLELTGDNPMDAKSWTKADQPVFERGNGVFGPGHNGFFTSPDGSENWLLYHGNNKETDGCSATRSVRAQPFTYKADGTPDFGTPVPEGQTVAAPSGENGPLTIVPEGVKWQLINRATQLCLTPSAQGLTEQACTEAGQWIIDPTTKGRYRLASTSGLFMGAQRELSAWVNQPTQQWQFKAGSDSYYQLLNAADQKPFTATDCKAEDAALCQDWLLLPAGNTVLSSRQSGKVLSTKECAATGDTQVTQQSWTKQACQQWNWKAGQGGSVQLQNSLNPELCVIVKDDALAAGADLVLGNCAAKSSQWALQLVVNGAVSLLSQHTKQVVDLPSCSLFDGVGVKQTPEQSDAICQQFQLRAVD